MACAMRPGFLLDESSTQSSTPMQVPTSAAEAASLVQAIDAEDCPVCLDALEASTSLLLPCRHMLCIACTKAVWTVAQSDPARRKDKLLECPMCRTAHAVAHGNMDAFVAAHQASNFGDAVPATPRAPPRTDEGLSTLTVAELMLVVRGLGIDVAGQLERSEIERAVVAACERRLPLGETAQKPLVVIPPRLLRAILEERAIPHADIATNSEELAKRIEQSPKGSCLNLPPRVLKQMLTSFGLGADAAMHIDKSELARQAMAARAIDRSRRAEQAEARRRDAEEAEARRRQAQRYAGPAWAGQPPPQQQHERGAWQHGTVHDGIHHAAHAAHAAHHARSLEEALERVAERAGLHPPARDGWRRADLSGPHAHEPGARRRGGGQGEDEPPVTCCACSIQ